MLLIMRKSILHLDIAVFSLKLGSNSEDGKLFLSPRLFDLKLFKHT